MKKIPNWIIIILVVALIIASKFIFFSKKENTATTNSKNKNSMPIAVNYYVVKPSHFSNTIFTTGKVGAFNQIDLLPEISGKVTAIYFKEGESVSKGKLLVKINDADIQAQLLKLKSQLKLSEQKLERVKKLIAVNGISQEEFDIQEQELSILKSDEAYLMAQLAKTNIVAPFNGVIGLKNISEGSYVNSTISIASLVQIKPLYIEFSVPEKYNSLLKNGLSLNFSNDDENKSNTYQATIYAIEPKVDEVTKTIKARAIYNGATNFYPGSFVKVFVNLSKTENTLFIPTQSVIPTLKGQKIFTYKNGLAKEQLVTIGVRTDEKIQILDGISKGDTIITTGLLSVKKDSKLKLLKAIN